MGHGPQLAADSRIRRLHTEHQQCLHHHHMFSTVESCIQYLSVVTNTKCLL